MAQRKATGSTKSTPRKTPAKKKSGSGFNLGKFTLGLIILISLGYGFLAFKEGHLIPSIFTEEDSPTETTKTPSAKEEPKPTEQKKIVQPSVKAVSPQLDFESFDLYFVKAFDFAWPSYEANQAIVERPYYTLRYSEEHEQAMWVAYMLAADSLNRKTYSRKDDFRKDPRIKTGSADLNDYKGSGYDRGHIAPAADFSYDEFALSQSFYMSNMSPQDPSFNRGVWKKLEEQVRDWAKEDNQIYVVTGPILNKRYKTIGTNKVSVPEYYYKIILDVRKPEIKAIAFLMKNERSSAALSTFVVTIDSVEKLTGLDFFPSMPDQMEDALEAAIMTSDWFK
ncbi:MAG: endonuclease G [Roseivirga sp.]|jgi:endonuclease G